MGQIIINTGNVANDGLGTPLRNAFDQVNYNFTQLFNAGPSGSNIVIANNSITVTNTNGNLRLVTNGVGSIVPAANFVPDIPNVRSLGAGTNRFNTVYAQYINANTGTFAGNVYVNGNLQVTGNVVTVNYSNLSVANSNITLATGAANAAQANGGGLLIPIAGANFTYNYSANSWNSTIAITAPTFIGDGANLTNVIANVQANALLGNTFSNSIVYSNLTSFGLVSALSATGNLSTTGNVYANTVTANTVTANYLAGNGSNITNITANAIVGNVPFALVANTAYVANLAALATQAINSDTALFAINANLASWANTATIAQTANAATYAVQADNANSAVAAGMAYQLAPTANLSVTGNITTSGYFIGDGSQLTGIVSSYSNSNVAAYLPTDNTIISIQSNISNTNSNVANLTLTVANLATSSSLANTNANVANLSTSLGNTNSNVANLVTITTNTDSNVANNTSNITTLQGQVYGNANVTANLAALGSNPVSTTGNVTASYFIGNGSQLSSLPAPVVTQDITSNGAMSIMTYDGNIKYVSYATIEPSSGNIAGGNISATGNITGGNISTGVITLTNGAVIKDNAGESVAFGQSAGQTSQGNSSVAIGHNAGVTSQGTFTVAIGRNAGQNTQGGAAVAIGVSAGDTAQGTSAVAIGQSAGFTDQSANTVAVGGGAGQSFQGVDAVAVGNSAGSLTQGIAAVAIGTLAGRTFQANNSIIINATGANLDQTTANTFTVSPVRNDVANTAQVMFYNTTSKEITYGNTISVAGNVTSGNIVTSGAGGNITLSGGNITGVNVITSNPTALANLTAIAGGRAFINNANLVAAGNFGSQVGSGGANTVPVWSDGSNWYIG